MMTNSADERPSLPEKERSELLLPLPLQHIPPLYPTALYPISTAPVHPWEDPRYSLSGNDDFHQHMFMPNVPAFNPANFMSSSRKDTHANYLNTASRRQPTAPRGNFAAGVTNADGVTTAVYSNVRVYEFFCNGVAIMRRQDDSWVNATHILKCAGIDKGRRTKILEREVHAGEHEKVQGGYGRYQGTWIPLERAREIAKEYEVDELLAPILNLSEINV